MSNTGSTEMDTDARDEVLSTGGTGVISFCTADDGPPHSVPVSYGYDAAAATFYFRLSADPDSKKSEISTQDVTFVVYGQADDRWWSVVATGQLEKTTDESIATETLQGLQNVHIPLVDIFGRPPKDVTFEFYRLVPDELTTRTESRTGV
jgi:hypothetical protein